ncbi:DUF6328 family protein [Microbacterium rhizomatis]|uniref:Sodium:proton antiporter n=1 Tax=Microbacterium rhizomatis TaxID=1631477 RepID=A0A5J5J2K0_9MICO|nr:DUF6328 family protein [Microbacterium rhizomatis]KAA9110280.1 sodium:proton antiporter [Microbacterium rhizomatis]
MSTPRRDDHREQRVDDLVDGRDETAVERADRNWNEVLQELRVLQTGTQILTGFLLALAFQPSFAGLTDPQRVVYLTLVVLATVAAIFALAPVALHRLVFRQHAKAHVVMYGHVALVASLIAVALLLVGVVAFVFDVVVGAPAAVIVIVILGVLVAVLWVVAPIIIRIRNSTKGAR